jgi:hypothetical protein
MMAGMSPTNYSLITAYPLKPNIGIKMLGYRIFKNEDLRSRSLQEVCLYYPINEKTICCFSTCMEKAKALK